MFRFWVSMTYGVTVAQLVLVQLVGVQILVGQQNKIDRYGIK